MIELTLTAYKTNPPSQHSCSKACKGNGLFYFISIRNKRESTTKCTVFLCVNGKDNVNVMESDDVIIQINTIIAIINSPGVDLAPTAVFIPIELSKTIRLRNREIKGAVITIQSM